MDVGHRDVDTVLLRAVGVHVRYRLDPPHALRLRGRERTRAEEIHAVRGVSLELRSGESLAIVGENGAGKSTLLGALAGLIPVSQGLVQHASLPRMLSVGAVLQAAWTGRESIRVGLAALGIPKGDRDAVEAEIETFIELGGAIDHPIRTYSRGMRARLLLAINTAVPADVLIVDEALGGADGPFQARAQQRLDAMLESSGALIVASHSRPTLERLCTRAILLRKGEVVASGSVSEVLDEHEG